MPRILAAATLSLLLPSGAAAEGPPRIVTDIAPVQSLASMVTGDLASVEALVSAGADPHDTALRPSAARALQGADLVIWIGPDLAPWLEGPLAALAPDADRIALMDLDATRLLPAREDALLHDHDHDHDHGDESAGPGDRHDDVDHHEGGDHGADRAEDRSHDHAGDAAGHDDDHGHGDHDGHAASHDAAHGGAESGAADRHAEADDAAGHGGGHRDGERGHGHENAGSAMDPHVWLDPDNAIAWLDAIAEALAARDPGNATRYRENAAAGVERIEAAAAEAGRALSDVGSADYVVAHDAYQYFERHFDLAPLGAISPSDATPASAQRLRRLGDATAAESDGAAGTDARPSCLVADAPVRQGLVEAVLGPGGGNVAVLSPLGAGLTAGPDLYPDLLRTLGAGIAECVAATG